MSAPKIQLNTDAMNALFPEGSEARVDLQQAVIQNFVDRNFRVNDEMVTAEAIRQVEYIKQEVRNMVAKELERYGVKYDSRSYLMNKLLIDRNSSGFEELRTRIRSDVDKIWRDKLTELQIDAKSRIDSHIKAAQRSVNIKVQEFERSISAEVDQIKGKFSKLSDFLNLSSEEGK